MLQSFLALLDPGDLINLSLQRVVDSRVSDSDKDLAIVAVMRIGSAIHESTNRSARKQAYFRSHYQVSGGIVDFGTVLEQLKSIRIFCMIDYSWFDQTDEFGTNSKGLFQIGNPS